MSEKTTPLNVKARTRGPRTLGSAPLLGIVALSAVISTTQHARAQQSPVTAEDRASATLEGVAFILEGAAEFNNRPSNPNRCVSCHVTAQAARAAAFAETNGYELTSTDFSNFELVLSRFDAQQKDGNPCNGLAGAIAHPNKSGKLYPNQTSSLAAVALAAIGSNQPLVTDANGNPSPDARVDFRRDDFLRLARFLACRQIDSGAIDVDWPNSKVHNLTGSHMSLLARSVIAWARAAQMSTSNAERQPFEDAIIAALPYLKDLDNLASGNPRFQEKAWVILALRAAGLPTQDSTITQLREEMLAAYHVKNNFGGWSWTGSTSAEIDTFGTGFTISALLAAGVEPSNPKIVQGIATLVRKQVPITIDGRSLRGWTDGPFGGTGVTDSTWPVIALSEIPLFTLDFPTPGDAERLESGDGKVHPVIVRGPVDLDPPYRLSITIDGIERASKNVTDQSLADRTLQFDWDVSGLRDGVHTIVAYGELDPSNPLYAKIGSVQRTRTIVREVILGDVVITDFGADPNPFKPSEGTTFNVDIAAGDSGADLTLQVYGTVRDALGVPQIVEPPVRTITAPKLGFGRHAIPWDGRNDAGAVVPDGLYVVKARAVEQTTYATGTARTITDERAAELIGGFQSFSPPIVRGTLHDENGKVPLGAQVQLLTPAGGVFQVRNVPETGRFEIKVLELGTYTLVGTAPGHEPDRRVDIDMTTEGQSFDYTLTVHFDRDGDGLSYGQETELYHTDPTAADTDGDGLRDGDEVKGNNARGVVSDPLHIDGDRDGITDPVEVQQYCTDPLQFDTDGDRLTDAQELFLYHTDPCNLDSDRDGLSDGDEVLVHHTDPNDPDTDGDGVDDHDELLVHGTDPNTSDTDGDGFPDGTEIAEGADPRDPTNSPERAPLAFDTEVVLSEDSPVGFSPNASDPNRDSLVTIWERLPASGEIRGDGLSFVYVPAPNTHGRFEATFRVSDGKLTSNAATLTFVVEEVNDPPSFDLPTRLVFDEDAGSTAVELRNVHAGAPDEAGETRGATGRLSDGAPVTLKVPNATVTSDTATLELGTLPDAHGVATLEVTVTDHRGASTTRSVEIEVRPVNDAPIPNAASVQTDEEQPVTIQLEARDVDGDTLRFRILTPPAHGSVRLRSGGVAVYTPDLDFFGFDTFTWVADDGTTSSQASATIEVRNVDDPPRIPLQAPIEVAEDAGLVTFLVAGIDAGAGEDDQALDLEANLVQNDAPIELVTDSVSGVGSSALLSFRTRPNANGSAEIRLIVTDAGGLRTSRLLQVKVTPVNDPPSADDLTVSTTEDKPLMIELPGSDVDGDALRYAVVSPPTHGVIELDGARARYTPELDWYGQDRFTFTVTDPSGEQAQATVAIDVTPVGDAPRFTDAALVVRANESAQIFLAALAHDPDGDALHFEIARAPQLGVARIENGVLLYTPAQSQTGRDTVVVRATEASGLNVDGSVAIEIVPFNHAPRARDAALAAVEDTPTSFDLSGVISDQDGDSLVVEIVDPPAHGTATLSGTLLRYEPDTDFFGSDTVRYLVSDGKARSATASVTINVAGRNDPPSAMAVSLEPVLETDRTGGVGVQLDASGSNDPDGDPLTYIWSGAFGEVLGEQVAVVLPVGVSTVTLTVRDRDGLESSVSQRVEVVAQPNRLEIGTANLPSGEVDRIVPVTVRLVDAFGNAIGGREVRFETFDGAEVIGTRTSTEADGFASTTVRLGTEARTYRVVASLTEDPDVSVTIDVEARAGAPASLRLLEPQPIRIDAGTAFALTVEVLDAFGNRSDAAPVRLSASLENPDAHAALTGTLAKTSANGLARFTDLRYDNQDVIRVVIEAQGDSISSVTSRAITVRGSEGAVVFGHGAAPDGMLVVDPSIIRLGISETDLGTSVVDFVEVERVSSPARSVPIELLAADGTLSGDTSKRRFESLEEAELEAIAIGTGDHTLRWTIHLEQVDPSLVTTPETTIVAEQRVRVRAAPPSAHVDAPRWIEPGVPAPLSAARSSDANADLLSYRWRVVEIPPGLSATFSAPEGVETKLLVEGEGEGWVEIELAVDDGWLTATTHERVYVSREAGPPFADAGFDRTIELGEPIALDGRASRAADGGPLSFYWRTVDAEGNEIEPLLEGVARVRPIFRAERLGTYHFELVVTDQRGLTSEPARVTITVSPPGETTLFAVRAHAPALSAGQSAAVATPITLQAEILGETAAVGSVSVFWEQVEGPDLGLGRLSGNEITIRAWTPGRYRFRVEAIDAQGQRSFDDVAFEVRRKAGAAYRAVASVRSGLDDANSELGARGRVGRAIELAAAVTSDARAPLYRWFVWKQRSGPTVALEALADGALRVTPRLAGTYRFELTAVAAQALGNGRNQTGVLTSTEVAFIVDDDTEHAPVLHVRADPPFVAGDQGLIALDESIDPDGDALSYDLRQRSPVGTIVVEEIAPGMYHFVAPRAGEYRFEAEVRDANGLSSLPQEITFSVLEAQSEAISGGNDTSPNAASGNENTSGGGGCALATERATAPLLPLLFALLSWLAARSTLRRRREHAVVNSSPPHRRSTLTPERSAQP